MTASKTKEAAFREFERLGPDHVRLEYTGAPTGTSAHYRFMRSLANEWLAQFEKESRLRNEASQAESLEIAKSAKDAAWAAAEAARDAADEAREANEIARTAKLIAIIAVIASAGIPIIFALLG